MGSVAEEEVGRIISEGREAVGEEGDEGAEETVVTTIMMMIIIWVLEVNTPLSLSPFHLAGLVDTQWRNCKQSETQRMQSFSIYHRKDQMV